MGVLFIGQEESDNDQRGYVEKFKCINKQSWRFLFGEFVDILVRPYPKGKERNNPEFLEKKGYKFVEGKIDSDTEN